MTEVIPTSDRLKGKVAIVTGAGCVGAGWGNGRAVAVLFALAGARVFAVDRDLDALEETLGRIREAGGEVTPYACDVTDSAAVAAMVQACTHAYGTVDILVNNVGGSAAGGAVAVQHAAAAARDLDALDGLDRDRRQDSAGQFVLVQAHAVDQDHHVLAAVRAEAAQVEAEVGRAVQALPAIHAADLADRGIHSA